MTRSELADYYYKDGLFTLQEGDESAGKGSSEFVRPEYPSFGNDAGDVFRRYHIEGGIVYFDTRWCDRMASMDGGDLRWVALFDWNLIPGLCLEVDRRIGCRDIKRNLVAFRENRH